MKKIIVAICLIGASFWVMPVIDSLVSVPTAEVAVAQLNGGNDVMVENTIMNKLAGNIDVILFMLNALIIGLMYKKEVGKIMKKGKSMKNVVGLVLIAGIMFSVTGCRKPYDTPEFKEIDTNETGFLIQLEGDSTTQDVFNSVELLNQNMVATKRVRIPHKWVQTGRRSWQGHYVPTAKLVKVNRSPVTRVWDAEPTRGTSTKFEALEAESKDSLSVSSGFSLTAYITPEDTAKFLFKYKGDNLSVVVDQQVKNSIQSLYTSECGKYDLIDLPAHKQDIIDEIRRKVIPFYKEWGITLAEDMGFVGGLQYDPEIQSEIDMVFKSQKKAERAEAELVAQEIENMRLLTITSNEVTMVKLEADGKAYAIAKEAQALKEAGQIYVDMKSIEKWDGVRSKVVGGGTPLLDLGGIAE